MDDPRYPVGKFERPTSMNAADRPGWLRQVEETPKHLRNALAALSGEQLDTPYRPGGWTVRQVAHHLPDSHLNAYVRFRLALTEDSPAIKSYEEDRWAELADARTAPVDVSLALLDAIHARWMLLLRSLSDEQWARPYRHPEMGDVSLHQGLALYAWHGRHHVGHVTGLRKRMGW